MKDKEIKIKEIIKNHILNNSKEYIIVTLIFIIGIFLGVLFINNIKELQKNEINSYFNNFIEKIKTAEQLDNMSLLKTSIEQNILLAVIIWFFGTTVIRNTCSFGNCFISWILFRIYYIYMYFYYGVGKRVDFYINNDIVTKFDFYTCNFSFSSKWF